MELDELKKSLNALNEQCENKPKEKKARKKKRDNINPQLSLSF